MGSKALDDQAAFELHDSRFPPKPHFCSFVILSLKPVILGRIQCGRVLAPFATYGDGVEFELGACRFLELFEILEKSAAGGDAELRLPATSAEGIHKLIFGDGLFHGLDRALIARHSPPVARWGSAGNQLGKARTIRSECCFRFTS